MEHWIEQALGVCETWKSTLAKASSSDGDAEDFLADHGSQWESVVTKTFGSSARKAVLKVGSPTVRNRLLKSIVAIVDLTKRLHQAGDSTGGPALALLQLQTELQRIESGLKRYLRRSQSATPAPGRSRSIRSNRKREGKPREQQMPAHGKPAEDASVEDGDSSQAKAPPEEPSKPPSRARIAKRRRTLPPPSNRRPVSDNDTDSVAKAKNRGTHQAWHEATDDVSDQDAESLKRELSDHDVMSRLAAADMPQPAEEIPVPEASGPVIPIDAEDLIEEIEEVEEVEEKKEESNVSAEADDFDVGKAATTMDAETKPADSEDDDAQTLDGITNSTPSQEASQSSEPRSEEDSIVQEPIDSNDVEIHPVDLTDDSLLEQPVLPLKKRKDGSGLVSIDMVDVPDKPPASSKEAQSPADKELQREILPEEINRLSGQDARIALLETYMARLRAARTLTQKQSAILDQVVTILGSALPHDPEALARTLTEIDHMYRSDDAPSQLSSEALETIVLRMRGLLDAMRRALHEATGAADLKGLDFTIGPVTALGDASDLPASVLAFQLVESMSRWRLPTDLLYARGPANFFEIRVRASKSVALSWPIPENRLELGIIGDLDEIWIYALHLIEPSADRPLGETATAGLPGAGVFYQISVPVDASGASSQTARTFAISETGRFLQALRRHVVRTD